MLIHLPEFLRTGGLKKTTNVRPIVRDGSGTPQGCGARRRRQIAISKSLINTTEIVTAATTPSCTIEVARNQINVLRGYKRTNGLDDFLGNTSFLGVDIVVV